MLIIVSGYMDKNKDKPWHILLDALYFIGCVASIIYSGYVWLQIAPWFCIMGGCGGESNVEATIKGLSILVGSIVVLTFIRKWIIKKKNNF